MEMIGLEAVTFHITKEEAELKEGRNLEKEEYESLASVTVHPSDHFGLLCQLKVSG